MDDLSLLQQAFPEIETELDFPFARHTTIGSGGIAAMAISPPNAERAAECIDFLEKNQIPHCYLGAGANVLPQDGRFEGVVVRFNRMKELRLVDDLIYASAGVTGGELLAFARAHSITGFEAFTGIPMTVGGAVSMNAGVAQRHMGDLVVNVVAHEKGATKKYSREECCFSLKNSIFLNGVAVLGAILRAELSDPRHIEEQVKFYSERRKHLPKGRSMGCTFVNPDGISAGELIERCGLKGLQIGLARVSEEHANFIINEGSVSDDIAKLIDKVKNEVLKNTGILLREEIRRIP